MHYLEYFHFWPRFHPYIVHFSPNNNYILTNEVFESIALESQTLCLFEAFQQCTVFIVYLRLVAQGNIQNLAGHFPANPYKILRGVRAKSEHGQGECLNVLCEGFTCI